MNNATTSSTAIARDIVNVLQNAHFSDKTSSTSHPGEDDHEKLLEWALVGEAAVQTHGLILQHLFNQIRRISSELWYWTEVSDSSRYTALYGLQTSPLRFWNRCTTIYQSTNLQASGNVLESSWRTFYGIADKAVREMIVDSHRVPTARPFASIKADVRAKVKQLEIAKSHCSTSVGFLLYSCFNFQR